MPFSGVEVGTDLRYRVSSNSSQVLANDSAQKRNEEVVELMQMKEGRCSVGPVRQDGWRELPCTAVFARARYLIYSGQQP